MSRENRQVYDEWAEEVSAKEDEIGRWREAHQRLQDDNDGLKEALEQLQRDKRALEWRLQSSENRSQEGYSTPVVGGGEGPRTRVRTVAEVVEVVKDWQFVRVFEQVAKDCTWISRIDGEGRARELGASEEDWMHQRGINFTGGESEATMNQYGDQRRFRDDDDSIVEMQPHVRVGNLRLHMCWSDKESRGLVGYFGQHLPIVSRR